MINCVVYLRLRGFLGQVTLGAKIKKVLFRLGWVAHPGLGAANKDIVQYTKSREIKDG